MFKKIAIAALLATAVFSQNGVLLGGYQEIEQPTLLTLQQNDANFSQALQTARNAYSEKNNGQLGNLVSCSQQIVAGINYKMRFQTENGDYEIVVFTQPWTSTYQVLEMKPAVTGQ